MMTGVPTAPCMYRVLMYKTYQPESSAPLTIANSSSNNDLDSAERLVISALNGNTMLNSTRVLAMPSRRPLNHVGTHA
jgi:hypothetical protein